MCFLGCLLLLSVNSVRSYRHAWEKKSSQFMVRLLQLMSRNRFETIGSFLHIVTPAEEVQLANHPLKKILPLHDYIKGKCLEVYQPLQELSVDERMVKSKARTHFRQYIKDKPTKWGFKYWVIADPTGYTIDCNIYCGASSRDTSEKGLSHKVVTDLIQPFRFQGYLLYCDSFYSSPALFQDLERDGIYATGTLRVNRRGVPKAVTQLKTVLNRSDVVRGTGYYLREDSKMVYCAWRDKKCIVMLSCAHPGQSDSTVRRRVKDATGSQTKDVAVPTMVKRYNEFMGGVDKSNQFMSYHRVLRQTISYWKTLFYHLIGIMATNAFIINWVRIERGDKRKTERCFRDELVLYIIRRYGSSVANVDQIQCADASMIRHGSTLQVDRGKCAWCQPMKSNRRCMDCEFHPWLCQVRDRDCHTAWHMASSDEWRRKFRKRRRRSASQVPTVKCSAGRPKGRRSLKFRCGGCRGT